MSVLNWERVGDRTVEDGRAFQQQQNYYQDYWKCNFVWLISGNDL